MANGLRWKIAQGIEVLWWRNYLRKKDPVEYAAWKRAYWADYFKRLEPSLSLNPGDRILDAGCGPAGIFMALEGRTLDAVDPLLASYESLPHFNRARHSHVRFFNETLETFAEEAPYDVVFCMNAVNHMENLAAAYDRLAALTRPGGTLVLTVDAHNYAPIKRFARVVPADILHPHQYDAVEYAAMLTARGFTVVDSQVVEREFVFSRVLQVARKN
jgi:2-polyprenyl-6-hydroxyphenyl methylase/3-demethylubiquinone-9 3-methyltransferase